MASSPCTRADPALPSIRSARARLSAGARAVRLSPSQILVRFGGARRCAHALVDLGMLPGAEQIRTAQRAGADLGDARAPRGNDLRLERLGGGDGEDLARHLA